jgi:hypothetical protein
MSLLREGTAMKIAIVSFLLLSVVLLAGVGFAQQSTDDPVAGHAQAPAQPQQSVHLNQSARRIAAFQSALTAVKEFCGKYKENASCKSDSTEYDAASKLVEKSPELQVYIETAVLPEKPIKFSSLPPPYKLDASTSGKSSMTGVISPADFASVAEARMDKACTYGLSMTAKEITDSMADCAKATDDWEGAIKSEAAVQNRVKAEAIRGSVAGGDYLISLTGTPGLPVTGNCSFGAKWESYDDILPAEHAVAAGRGVICSFVKKYAQGTLKMQIIQNGTVRKEVETEASYGDVTLDVDW